ncbi:helix-turn-helix domain-containing protein [Aquimarina sp. 2304DJ70-9]|uniref:helix-turn-helix domain-containing protein n=1 Tax=Aquimarina penaris TaxID=3231044 RepID=UPI0034619FEB
MVFIAGIAIAILIEFLLFSKKQKTESDQILTLWMFLIIVHLILFYLEYTNLIFEYPFLLGVAFPLPLLQSVFLYLYVASLTNLLPKRKLMLWLHFLPAIFMYIYLIQFFILSPDQKIWVFKNNGAGYKIFMIVLNYATMMSGVTYVIWSLLLLRKYRNNILDKFSDVEKIDLRWLQFLTAGMGVIWLIVIFEEGNVFTFGGVTLFIFLIAFFGIKQVRVFDTKGTVEQKTEQREKYAKSSLKEDAASELYKNLTKLMQEESLFKNTEISIGDLASRLNVHPNHLSQVINEKEGRNFYDFVNNYRLQEFKLLISNPKNHHLTLLSLAYDCGFNSKSAFNRYFKKALGQTPSEYFASIKKN